MVGQAVILRSTVWFIPHPQNSCADLHNSTGVIARNTSNSSSCIRNSSSTMLLPHRNSRQSGHHNSLHLPGSRATIAGSPEILLETAAK
jgi:hypothetical protein